MSGNAIVFGASGAVGEATAHALIALGWRVIASMRTPREAAIERLEQGGASVRYDDLELDGGWAEAAAACDAIVFATHLSLTILALARIPVTAQTVVAFSSNNVAIQPDASAYAELADAERTLRARLPRSVIIRPTMIYGDPRLETLTRLMRMARTSPYLPLPGSGRALAQPVFHEDLGRAAAWLASAGQPGVYAIGGPDSVTMHALYREIIRASGGKARVLSVPAWLLRAAAPALSAMKLYSGDQTSRADRDRLAVKQTPLPPEILAKVHLREGLARLAAALRTSEADGSQADGR